MTPYWFELGRNEPRVFESSLNPFLKVKKLKERFKTPKGYKEPPKCYESSPYEMWVVVNFVPHDSTVRIYFKREEDMILARLMV
jgi:hypothetical protein